MTASFPAGMGVSAEPEQPVEPRCARGKVEHVRDFETEARMAISWALKVAVRIGISVDDIDRLGVG